MNSKRRQDQIQVAVDAHWEKTLEIIRTKGWAVQAIFGTDKQPPFTYSVGLAAKGLPDILVIGPAGVISAKLINGCAQAMLDGAVKIADRELVTQLSEMPLALQLDDETGTMRELMRMVRKLAMQEGHTASAVQLVLPDKAGRFPWDKGCDPKFRDLQSAARLLALEEAAGHDDEPESDGSQRPPRRLH